MGPLTVDEFVEHKVQREFRDIVAELRALMRRNAPRAREVISYAIPMYVGKKPLAWISPSKTGITVGFREGASFEDKYGLLKSASRHSRNLRIKSLKDLNRTALRYYIRQAVEFDKY